MRARQVLISLYVLVAMATLASAAPMVNEPKLKPSAGLQLSSRQLTQTFAQVLTANGVPAEKQRAVSGQFSKLPAELQHTLLMAMDAKYAVAQGLPEKMQPKYRIIDWHKLWPLLFTPNISGFFPEKNSPGNWTTVFGGNLSNDTKVIFDGVQLATTFYGPDVDFFPNSLCFQVPVKPLATNHTVVVRNTVKSLDSAPATYRIVAPMGYRGYNGWQFANFGDPTIPWEMFKDFFGAAAVEDSPGHPKPSAQAWYNSTYKGVGNGGNCYGMSNSSLRIRNGTMTTYWHGWFSAHHQPYCWLYPWQTETKQSVQEDQGGQLSVEVSYYANDYYNHQSHQQAWNRIQSLCTETTNRPVMCFWGPGWGHAVVPYNTSISGSQHRVQIYDNNEPYAENETGGPDKSIAYVDWNNGSFHANSYASANKMICLSHNECMTPPHLPAGVGNTTATGALNTVIAVVEGGTVQQIVDENGRRFLNDDGGSNEDAATRIPDSMRFFPFTGNLRPSNFPSMFIFNHAANKSLTFSVAGGGAKALRVFMDGSVFEAEFGGQGQLRANGLLGAQRSLELLSPAALRPTRLRCINALAIDRVFELSNIRQAAGNFLFGPQPGGTALRVETGGAGQFDLRTQTLLNGQVSQLLFPNLGTQANSRAILQWDFRNRGAQLQFELRSLNNQPIRNQQIRGM